MFLVRVHLDQRLASYETVIISSATLSTREAQQLDVKTQMIVCAYWKEGRGLSLGQLFHLKF